MRNRAAAGLLGSARWHPMHQTLTVQEALAILAKAPSVDRLVVCHGDACAPNTLLTGDGTWSGDVDFGALGVADRWADLAIATWSTEWNYGQGWTGHLLDAYAIDPDPSRMAYYRLRGTLARSFVGAGQGTGATINLHHCSAWATRAG